jgi:hypothetical protein
MTMIVRNDYAVNKVRPTGLEPVTFRLADGALYPSELRAQVDCKLSQAGKLIKRLAVAVTLPRL